MSDLTRARIGALRKRIEAELDELERLAESVSRDTDPVELDQQRIGRLTRADAMQRQAMEAAAGERRAARVTALKAALARIGQGEYGWCRSCDEPIAVKRLEADPAALLCLACAGGGER